MLLERNKRNIVSVRFVVENIIDFDFVLGETTLTYAMVIVTTRFIQMHNMQP